MKSKSSLILEEALREFASAVLVAGPCTLDLFVMHRDQFGQPEFAELVAAIRSSPIPVGRIGSRHRLADFAVGRLITAVGQVQILPDIERVDHALDSQALQILRQAGIRSIVIVPLYDPISLIVGIATISWPQRTRFTVQEVGNFLAGREQLSNVVALNLQEHGFKFQRSRVIQTVNLGGRTTPKTAKHNG